MVIDARTYVMYVMYRVRTVREQTIYFRSKNDKLIQIYTSIYVLAPPVAAHPTPTK